MTQRRQFENRLSPLSLSFEGLNGKTDGNLARAIEKLKHVVADQAAKLASAFPVLSLIRSGDSRRRTRDK